MTKESGLSRRNFLTIGGIAALSGAAALAGCSSPTVKDDTSSTSTSTATTDTSASAATATETRALAPNGAYYPWSATPPAITDDMVEATLDCDVAVLGLGVAGCAAFRAASEAGAKVIGIEKGATPQCRSSQYAYVNGKYSDQLGLKPDFDLEEVLQREWEEGGCISNVAIIKKWLYNHTEAVDWWIDGADCYVPAKGEVMKGNAMMGEVDPDHPVNVTGMSDITIDYENENQAAYPEDLNFSDHQAMLDRNLARGTALGNEVYFGHFAEQPIMNGSRVVGVYVRNAETGKYKKINAANGIVCSMGDGASNPDILGFFYPQVVENGNFSGWPNFDVEGNPTNTGDVYPLGYWAGAGFSQYQAPMLHVMGGPGDSPDFSASMGFTGPLLRLNYNGKRVSNEDLAATEYEFIVENQPKKKMFNIFDSHFDEFAAKCVNTFSTPLAMVDQSVGNGAIFKGETLEELFKSIDGMNVDAALASVARYNELAEKGVDEDFGKKQKYLDPIKDGPFYAQKIGMGMLLTTMGGISSDEDAHALTPDHEIVPGMYVAGNSQGDRFAVKYPFKLSGTSHCMAMFYGKVAGENAAAGK